MSYQLKIKAKHLGAEARIIRFEEIKTKRKISALKERIKNSDDPELRLFKAKQGFKLQDLQHHRKSVVRPAARRTHLARAYLKGLPYKYVEQKLCSKPPLADKRYPNWISRGVKQISQMVNKYGGNASPEDIQNWITKDQ